NSKLHWENIYKSKEIDGVSWYQETPTDSLNLIESLLSIIFISDFSQRFPSLE
mgnify:CR=1